MSSVLEPMNMLNLKNRMKARIALANFKLEHGYSNIDLRTLESCLRIDKTYKKQPSQLKKRKQSHQFYPRYYDMDRLIKKNTSNRASPAIPLSNTRLTKRLSLSSDVEAAAQLLVFLHHSPSLYNQTRI